MPSHRHCLIKRTDRLRELPLRRWRVPTPRAPIGSTTPRLPKERSRRATEAHESESEDRTYAKDSETLVLYMDFPAVRAAGTSSRVLELQRRRTGVGRER